MQVGAWKSYDELESNLTLDELYELYHGIMSNKIEEFKNMARANGATFEDEDKQGEKEPVPENDGLNPFQKILKEVDERNGVTEDKKPQGPRSIGIFNITSV